MIPDPLYDKGGDLPKPEPILIEHAPGSVWRDEVVTLRDALHGSDAHGMDIPKEAVEAAASATWDDVDYPNYDYHVDLMTKALDVAAPHIAAQALREAADAMAWESSLRPTERCAAMKDTAHWLIARAETLEGE